MGESIGKILDWLKSPRQSAIVFLAALALLLVPPNFRATLGLQVLERYRGWVSLAAAVSGATLVVESVALLLGSFKSKRREKAIRREGEEYLRALSLEEKGIMLEYLASPSDTQYLHSTDGNVGSLKGKGLIYPGSSLGQLTPHGPRFAYNIQPWVKEFLIKHPDVLAGAQNPALPPSPFRGRSWMS